MTLTHASSLNSSTESPLAIPVYTVFVVNDDILVCNALRRALRAAGFHVEAFTSAERFLAAYPRTDDTCLIVDLRMQETSGLQLLDKMRRRGIEMPVIVYSGDARVKDVVRAMQDGAFTVIEKPMGEKLLIEQIPLAIRQFQAQQERRMQVAAARRRLLRLTERERQIADGIAEGLSTPELAARWAVSPRTVETHRANIYRKLDTRSPALLTKLILLAETEEPLRGFGPAARDS